MYRVWPCPLTRTVPTPRTLVALIVAEAADEAPDGVLLSGEPAAVLEDDEPHAATVAAVPSARPPASSQLLSGPRRCLNLFLLMAPFISMLHAPFRSVFGLILRTVSGSAAGAKRCKSAACRSRPYGRRHGEGHAAQ